MFKMEQNINLSLESIKKQNKLTKTNNKKQNLLGCSNIEVYLFIFY